MIIVCGLQAAPELVVEHDVGAAIGILGPETKHPDLSPLTDQQRLRLAFNDINEPVAGMIAASEDDATRLISFIKGWDQKQPLLIHCWAGISRSTATAFAAQCILHPTENELVLAQELRAASPFATPNRLITAKIDKALGRNCRMIRAIESIGRGADAFSGQPFILKS